MSELEKLRRSEVLKTEADRVRIERVFRYDFGALGGAQGAVTLVGIDGEAAKLPAGALVHSVTSICRTAATSGGAATIALGYTGSAAAFDAATAYTDNSYDTVGTTDRRSTTPILIGAADVSVLATIADADLTAGVFDVHVEMSVPRG